jgi:glutaredoxin 3
MYTTRWCGYCDRAKALLEARGLAYEEIRSDHDPEFRAKVLDLTGRWTVPQILVGGKPIGGFTELRERDRRASWTSPKEPAAPPGRQGRAGSDTRSPCASHRRARIERR